MVLIVKQIWHGLSYGLDKYSHPKTKEFFLASNPLPLFILLIGWLYFCLVLGPRLMKNRKPYDLKNTLMVYNFIQIVFSVYIFYQGGKHGWFGNYNFYCQPIEYYDEAKMYTAAQIVWMYYVAKITELLDTVFFVLRKKDNQITTLHVYHHTIMPIIAWMGLRFSPGGHGTFVGWINTFVHIIMYTYYFIAGLGPQYQKYLWWKKHLTALQLIQFIMIFFHNFPVLFRDCDYPKWMNLAISLEAILFIYMFGNFYYKNYMRNRKKE